MWVLAALGLALREAVPVELLSHWSERIVGATLIAIGLWGLRRAAGLRIHAHVHTHDGVRHAHIHAHHRESDHSRSAAHDHRHAALAIGVLHGLAGTSHLLGVLPALALPTRGAAVAYLLAYGIGSIAAMTGFAAVVGRVARQRTRTESLPAHRVLQVCSLAAIVVGVAWVSGVAG
ncbi:MAG: hypothetical protein D6744_11580 [Planctomycetota bacterium]|nr:MAG: hypothetical protein D6744_11580 [Planctomycetota bacterium]